MKKTGFELGEDDAPTSLSIKALTQEDIDNINTQRDKEEQLSNIDRDTLQKLKALSKKSGVPILIRPVNECAYPWLKNGAVGKNMAVHGKSSEEGPTRGLIPVNASISKAANGNNKDKIKLANNENQDSLKKSYGLIKEYENARDRKELVKLQQRIVIDAPLLTKDGKEIYIFENNENLALRDKEGKACFFVKSGEEYVQIDEDHNVVKKTFTSPTSVEGYKAVQVKVMAKPEFQKGKISSVKAVTADIDVLAYGDRIINLGFDGINLNPLAYPQMEGISPKEVQSRFRRLNIETGNRDLISHGSEQYNLYYPQPLDKEWISVAPDGKIKKLHNEMELIAEFNQYIPLTTIAEGGVLSHTSLVSNPWWGWKQDASGKYVIDHSLKELIKESQDTINDAKKLKNNVKLRREIERTCNIEVAI